LPPAAAMIVSIRINGLIAVTGIGYALLSIIGRPSIIDSLESHGFRVIV